MGCPFTEKWVATLTAPQLPECTSTPGPLHNLDNDNNELDFFKLVFPDSLLQNIVAETNRYAAARGPDSKWRDTTVEELRAYIGINIIMGIVVLPDQKSYWSTDPLFKSTGIPDIMTRDRFGF